MMRKADIAGLAVDPTSNYPVLLLKVEGKEQVLPVMIGMLEAASIASVMRNVVFDRPMTHDLFKNFIETVGSAVEKVEVVDLRDNTFFAKLYLAGGGENGFQMDARPSDAIALAVRFNAPIFIDDAVLDKAQNDPYSFEVADNSDEGKKWAEYLKNLSAEDFGDYKV